MIFILSNKEKSVYFMKDMDDVWAMNEFEVKLSQEKIEFINDVYQKKIYYWKKAALESCFNQKWKEAVNRSGTSESCFSS